ncbi:MAG: hypothetical protein L0Y80_05380, partial [Ignavibacteriae bacterium]|nr:hypothetical protein [Ignavibacteriota bacterium]
MPVRKVDTIWMNGKLVKWEDAKIHVLSHVIHYGSSWFEGIRCYDTKRGAAISYNEAIDPQQVRDALKRRPDIGIVSVVHHDTPSG